MFCFIFGGNIVKSILTDHTLPCFNSQDSKITDANMKILQTNSFV